MNPDFATLNVYKETRALVDACHKLEKRSRAQILSDAMLLYSSRYGPGDKQ